MKMELKLNCLLICALLFGSCSPARDRGNLEGAFVGTAVGAGAVSLIGSTRYTLIPAGILGGALGYYVTTLRFTASGVTQAGGHVYQLGQYVTIDIPSDQLFEANTSDFLPQAFVILNSAADVLKRFPNNNILISAHTSGFARERFENKLSSKRAHRVSQYLRAQGLSLFKAEGKSMDMRKINAIGRANKHPIAHEYTNDSLRANSHIQIISYPQSVDLLLDQRNLVMNNIGSLEDNVSQADRSPDCSVAVTGQCGKTWK